MTIISILIFLFYLALIIAKYGIPKSISDSYYLLAGYNNSGKKLLFMFTMWAVAFCLMPPILTALEFNNLQFLAFLSCVGLAFVGAAPMFKDGGMTHKVHTYSAYLCAICSLLISCVALPYWWVTLMVIMPCSVLALIFKNKRTFWLEIGCFINMFIIALIIS